MLAVAAAFLPRLRALADGGVDAVTAADGQRPLDRRVRDDATVAIEDARTGFYMVRTAALYGARASLSGAHLADALGATVALARICHGQGYDADEQRAEVTLDQLVAEHLRVSRERVVRILDQLQRAGVIERHSARFDGARRRPTEIRFTGAAVPFARVDARRTKPSPAPPAAGCCATLRSTSRWSTSPAISVMNTVASGASR
jgi:hypothetical protein